MTVPRQSPGRIDLDKRVWQAGVFENSAPQHLFDWFLRAKLGHDDERRGPTCARQLHRSTKDFARDTDPAFNGFFAAVRYNQSRKRYEPRVVFCRQPGQPRPEMWPIVIEIAAEKCRHE